MKVTNQEPRSIMGNYKLKLKLRDVIQERGIKSEESGTRIQKHGHISEESRQSNNESRKRNLEPEMFICINHFAPFINAFLLLKDSIFDLFLYFI